MSCLTCLIHHRVSTVTLCVLTHAHTCNTGRVKMHFYIHFIQIPQKNYISHLHFQLQKQTERQLLLRTTAQLGRSLTKIQNIFSWKQKRVYYSLHSTVNNLTTIVWLIQHNTRVPNKSITVLEIHSPILSLSANGIYQCTEHSLKLAAKLGHTITLARIKCKYQPVICHCLTEQPHGSDILQFFIF